MDKVSHLILLYHKVELVRLFSVLNTFNVYSASNIQH